MRGGNRLPLLHGPDISTSILVASGKGAENGLIFRTPEVLQTAHNLGTVMLDKTGTLPRCQPKLTDFERLPGGGLPTDALQARTASMDPARKPPWPKAITTHHATSGIQRRGRVSETASPSFASLGCEVHGFRGSYQNRAAGAATP